MEGQYTKDVVVVPEFDNHDDLDIAYDSFRVEKKLTKCEQRMEEMSKEKHLSWSGIPLMSDPCGWRWTR